MADIVTKKTKCNKLRISIEEVMLVSEEILFQRVATFSYFALSYKRQTWCDYSINSKIK